MPALSETIELATLLHHGVTDSTGRPYINHPMWVMNALPPDADEDTKHLALLHDTVEDCKPRLVALIHEEMNVSAAEHDIEALFGFFQHRGYSSSMIEGLRLLTRDLWNSMTYLEWIEHIAQSGHRGAIMVKYADNRHNSDPERITMVLADQQARVVGMQRRYERSKRVLEKVLLGRALGAENTDDMAAK